MIPTFDQGVSADGVTSLQCAPSSRDRQTNPSSVPAQRPPCSSGEGPIAYTTPRRGPRPSSCAAVGASRFERYARIGPRRDPD